MIEPVDPTLAEAMTELAALLLRSETVDDLMQQIARLAARMVPVADSCSILLAYADRTLIIGASDERAQLLNEQLYDLDEGPCLEALRTGGIVSSENLADDTRWGHYPAIARSVGAEACHCSPLRAHGSVLGVLNLYSTTPHVFEAPIRSAIAELNGLCSAGLAATLRNFDEAALSNHLRNALTTRSVIDQAVGIVMSQRRCTAPEAFSLLRKASQRRNVRLVTIAVELTHDVVASRNPQRREGPVSPAMPLPRIAMVPTAQEPP